MGGLQVVRLRAGLACSESTRSARMACTACNHRHAIATRPPACSNNLPASSTLHTAGPRRL